jgi:hypothetical protein
MRSAIARMVTSTRHEIEKTLCHFVIPGSFIYLLQI